eukprot:gnl/MRDRNA2_/MRDRNA2_118381_c0_seq1.p1 gnl/MRDRNA2_/MRDRNA2_118381_c0~~gnl/MRDRNA2_/MRDRNA2_118381_c0_seq1.p1  ORF type:complete len:128 (-),score=43.49 gnl/MRDRNA2_/MRDRNA2_118381_c0_seq1:67-450(-)
MGCGGSKPLQPETIEKLKEFFKKMDIDGNGDISKDEATKFWGKNFAKVNADAMFNEVADGSGSITEAGFLEFWSQVKKSGYKDKDILDELESMMEGGSWVDWKDQRSTGNEKSGDKGVAPVASKGKD